MIETPYSGVAWVLSLAVAAAVGSVPFTVLVPRALGHDDPRTSGSGTPGVANVAMSVGYGAGVAVALLEGAKGVIAVLLPRAFGLPFEAQAASLFAAVVMTAHSPFLRFRGGHARTPGIWGLLAAQPLVLPVLAATYGATLAVARSAQRADVATLLAIGPALGLATRSVSGLVAGACFSAFYLWRKSILGSDAQHYRIFGELTD
ncbi:MAG: glycerol-3-phosphate acyltransferase [Coriobacteriia bacterium]|nr:glycerol-3-phosphate acyltransferase [Coriobacteriia bacterium]